MSNKTEWLEGALRVDGTPSKDLIKWGESMGLIKRSREVFDRTGKAICKPKAAVEKGTTSC